MADWYVDSAATGTGSGADWTNAKTTLAAAIAASATSEKIYVASTHSETSGGAGIYTFKGTNAAPQMLVSVNKTTMVPTPGASVAASGTGYIGIAGVVYAYGVYFSTSNAGVGGYQNNATIVFESCRFQVIDPYNTRIGFGSYTASAATVILKNCWFYYKNAQPSTFSFGGGSDTFFLGGGMLAGSAANGSGLIGEIGEAGRGHGSVVFDGFDFSALPTATNIVRDEVTSGSPVTLRFNNCKMPSGWTGSWITGSTTLGRTVIATNCDGADTNYRYEAYKLSIGSVRSETTVVRTGGATDGTTPASRKMATLAGSSYAAPLVGSESVLWNETIGTPVTATIEVLTDGVTLTDAECWLEVQYLGTSGFPLGASASDQAALLATPVAQTASTATWTTTGITTPVKQKLHVTFTPQEKGFVQAVVKLAKPSTTVYVCPKLELS